jgi:hypothetical protein
LEQRARQKANPRRKRGAHPTDVGALEARAIARGKREILEDIKSGRVPSAVRTFSELHDYVDANEYGGLTDSPNLFEGVSRHAELAAMNRVQDALEAWLSTGRRAGAKHKVVASNPRLKATSRRMPGPHMVANPEREDFPIDPFAMLFELERLEESAKTLSDADVRSALAESKKKLKSAADRLRRVQKGSDRRAVTEASQLRGHYAGMSFILETELAERGLRPFPRHDNPRPAKRSRYEGLDTAIMLAASSIAGNVADTRDYATVWSSPLEAVNMSEGTAELLWREGEFGSSTGYPFEKAWPSIKRDALGMTKQIWFDVKSNPRAAKPASKRTGSRTSAQSNAAKAMKLFHSGQASSLAEAWAMLRRR